MSNLTQLITKPLTKNDLENVVNYLKGSAQVVDYLKGKKNKEVKLNYDEFPLCGHEVLYFSIDIGDDRYMQGHISDFKRLEDEWQDKYPLLKERYTSFYMYADDFGKGIMNELAFRFGGYWNPSEHELYRGESKETFFPFKD